MAEQSKVLNQATLGERGRFLHHARRAFLDALQTFFSQESIWGEPNPYQWIPNSTETKMVIAAEFTEDQEIPTPRHMILVNRGTLSFPKLHINNLNEKPASPIRRPVKQGSAGKNLGTTFSTLGYTEMQIQCFSMLPDQAEEIAWGAGMAVMTFQNQIRERGRLHRIDNPQIGPSTPIARSDSKIMMSVVPITVPVVLPIAWRTTQASVKFGGTELDTETLDC